MLLRINTDSYKNSTYNNSKADISQPPISTVWITTNRSLHDFLAVNSKIAND